MTSGTHALRERLLSRLLGQPDRFLSGEALCAGTNLTRAAIWKHMQSLQAGGWPIESVHGKGYRLPGKGRYPFSEAAIRSFLHREGDAFWRVSLREEVDSTSTRLKEAASLGEPEGAVLIAETQTGGRGRMGRQWSSLPGQGIWMSVLLRPDLAPHQVQTLTLAASVAVVQAIRDTLAGAVGDLDIETRERMAHVCTDIGIKWPNDILWNGRKLCGILTELAAEPDRLSHVVMGIGLNVTHQAADFPEDLRETATSLAQVCASVSQDIHPDRNHLATQILLALARNHGLLCTGRLAEVLSDWRSLSHTLGNQIRVMDPEGPWQAEAVDIGEDGRLKVKGPDGAIRWLLSGEISIRPSGEGVPAQGGSR
jgi:BirA family transcriptional regulator, biotin operon repressor / biotin---[acetyl-CoA-carboxylase] ligase